MSAPEGTGLCPFPLVPRTAPVHSRRSINVSAVDRVGMSLSDLWGFCRVWYRKEGAREERTLLSVTSPFSSFSVEKWGGAGFGLLGDGVSGIQRSPQQPVGTVGSWVPDCSPPGLGWTQDLETGHTHCGESPSSHQLPEEREDFTALGLKALGAGGSRTSSCPQSLPGARLSLELCPTKTCPRALEGSEPHLGRGPRFGVRVGVPGPAPGPVALQVPWLATGGLLLP